MPEPVPIPPERPFDETWHGHPLVDGDGADRHSEILVDVLWSHGITSRQAAERQGVSHQRLAAYLRTSESTITRAVNVGVAKGLLKQLDLPRTSAGGAGKFVWLTPKGVAAAPVIVQYNLVSAGTHLLPLSGVGNVTLSAGKGEAGVVAWQSTPWRPSKITREPLCPDCLSRGNAYTPGVCWIHGWVSSLIWRLGLIGDDQKRDPPDSLR